MPFISIIIVLIIVGLLLWLVNRYIPMYETIKSILNIVVVVAVILWLLGVLGVLEAPPELRFFS